VTGPEQLPPKSLMPLWLNDFSSRRRRSIEGAPRQLNSAAFDAFCRELKPARRELASIDVLSWTAFDVLRYETLIPLANRWRPTMS